MPHVYGGGNVQIDRRSERERVSSLFSGSSDKLCPFNQGGRGGRGRRQIRFGIRWEQETRTIIREISSVINLIFRFFFLFEQFLFEKYRARWIENSQFAIGRKLHCSSRRRKTLISRLKLKKSSLGCSPCWREAKIFAFLQMTRRKLDWTQRGRGEDSKWGTINFWNLFDRLLTLFNDYILRTDVGSLYKRLGKTIRTNRYSSGLKLVEIESIELAHEYTRNLAITKSNLSAQMANSQKFPSVSTRLERRGLISAVSG